MKSPPIAKLKLIDGPWWRRFPSPPVFLLLLRSSCEERIKHISRVVAAFCNQRLSQFPSRWPQRRGKADKSIRINGARLKLLHVFYGNSSSASLFASESHYVPPQEEEFSKNTLINH